MPVKQNADDDEQSRHRQQMRQCFRGHPLGGMPHAVLSLNLGMTHRCARTRKIVGIFYSEHPAIRIRLILEVPSRRISIVPPSNSNTAAIGLSYVALASGGR